MTIKVYVVNGKDPFVIKDQGRGLEISTDDSGTMYIADKYGVILFGFSAAVWRRFETEVE